ncbi:pentapeptide repeat-containing protein [Desulfovibrio sp. OttesenSCG-928-I05]|nr:pentapeptide repeat-containing protein [Desulfovibrio sp. OttesenSCG-928-I05]
MQRRLTSLFLVCLLATFSAALGGCVTGSAGLSRTPTHTGAGISANPHSIDGQMVVDSDLSGLRLQNITLKNTAFLGSSGRNIELRNVIFENCRFINTRLSGGIMENVTFRGGLFTCEDDQDNLDKRSVFSGVTMKGVLFDGASMDNFIMDVKNSSIILRGMHSIRALEPMIRGTDINLVIEDCVFMRIPAITDINGKSSLLVRDSTFATSTFGKSAFERVLFERCITYGGAVYTPPSAR